MALSCTSQMVKKSKKPDAKITWPKANGVWYKAYFLGCPFIPFQGHYMSFYVPKLKREIGLMHGKNVTPLTKRVREVAGNF